MIQAVWC